MRHHSSTCCSAKQARWVGRRYIGSHVYYRVMKPRRYDTVIHTQGTVQPFSIPLRNLHGGPHPQQAFSFPSTRRRGEALLLILHMDI